MSIRIFSLTLFCISLLIYGCGDSSSSDADSTSSGSSNQQTHEDISLTNNNVTRCALGIGAGVTASVGGIWDSIKGLWSGFKYIVEYRLDVLMQFHWNKSFREIAKENLAEKRANQRALAENLVNLMSVAVPMTREYLNEKHTWYNTLPHHYQSEFLCKLLITIPADIVVGIAGTKGIQKIGEIEGFAKAVDKVKDGLKADLGSRGKFTTKPDDWKKKGESDSELERAMAEHEAKIGGVGSSVVCAFSLRDCVRPDGKSSLSARAAGSIANRGWETAFDSSSRKIILMVSVREQKDLMDAILKSKYDNKPNSNMANASPNEKMEALSNARSQLLEESKSDNLKTSFGKKHDGTAFEEVPGVALNRSAHTLDEISDHFVKTGDGWTNQRTGKSFTSNAPYWAE